MSEPHEPSRGDVWLADLNPTRGHEQAGRRPALIVSDDSLNHGPSGLLFVIPMTTREKGIPFHIEVNPPEGGLRERSFILCDQLRCVSRERLSAHWGSVSGTTMSLVADRLRVLLAL